MRRRTPKQSSAFAMRCAQRGSRYGSTGTSYAYWGEDLVNYAPRVRMGNLPASGTWVREPTTLDWANKQIIATVTHFSLFTLGTTCVDLANTLCFTDGTTAVISLKEPTGLDTLKVSDSGSGIQFSSALGSGALTTARSAMTSLVINAGKSNVEINGNPDRRDLSDVHARAAAEAGAMIVIDSDAHRIVTLQNIRWGVATARRAWVRGENDWRWPRARASSRA